MADGKITVKNYDGKSSTLLNAIRTEASDFYKERVPEATQDNLEVVMSSIQKYDITRNEYAYAVVDKIAFTEIANMDYKNDLARFKMASYSYAKDIEELFVDLIKSQEYNADGGAQELFKRVLPTVLSVYHTVNRADVYPITIEEELLTMAFTSEQQGQTMISSIMGALETSSEVDEFLIMKNLMNTNIVEGRLWIETVSPIVDEATARAFTTKVKATSKKMKFPTTKYNFSGVTQTTPLERQVFITDPDTMAINEVEVMAVSFHKSFVDYEAEQVLVDDFGSDDSNVVGILCDERWFRCRDRLREMRMQPNGATLSYNAFKHVWQSISVSPFHNAVVFVTVEPTLTAVDVLPATISTGANSFVQFRIETTGSDYPSSKVNWSITGNSSSKTFITSTGLLYLGSDEVGTAGDVTVTGTSVVDAGISDTAVVTVV